MSCGFYNKVLRVDLFTREVSVEEPGEVFFRTYFGGWGIIAHYLLKEVEPGVDPLGPGNALVFATGVVTGAPIGGSGRSAVGAKSPLTGQAAEPVYLWIKDDVSHWRFSTPFETVPTDGSQVPTEDIAQAIELHHEMRGWDKETGAPTRGKLYELGVGWVAELLYSQDQNKD